MLTRIMIIAMITTTALHAQSIGGGTPAPTTPPQTKWGIGPNTPQSADVYPGKIQHPCLQLEIERVPSATTPVEVVQIGINVLGNAGAWCIDRYELWLDANSDGAVDAGDTLVVQSTTGVFQNPPINALQPGEIIHLLVTMDLGVWALPGTTIQFMACGNAPLYTPTQFNPHQTFASLITVNGVSFGGALGKVMNVVQPPAPDFSPTSAPDATVGQSYDLALAANSGAAPFTWSLASGNLPPGLILIQGATSGDANIAGLPTMPGTFNFEIELQDALGASVTHGLVLAVHTAPVTPTTPPPVAPAGATSGSAGCVAGPATLAPMLLPMLLFRRKRK